MLKKELLLQQFVGGWRKLTVAKMYWPEYFGWATKYYGNGGEISDNTVDGDPFHALVGWWNPSAQSGWRRGTAIRVDSWYWPSLYVKREGGNLLHLSQYKSEGLFYQARGNSEENQAIFEEDLGKTINIYVGTTPP